MKYLSIAVLIVVSASFTALSNARAEVHFRQASFDEAKKLAAQEHKKIMVDFYTGWCGWCKVLDRNTYSDEEVGKFADDEFISIKLDAEHEGKELASKSKVRGYPTIVFFTASGEEIDRVVGYEDPQHFMQSMKTMASGGAKAILDEINGPHPPADAAKWATAANYYEQHNDVDRAIGAYRQVEDLDKDNKQHLKEEAVYGIAMLTAGDAQFPLLEQAITAYPMRPEGQRASAMLINYYFESNKPQDAERTVDRWAMTHPQDAQVFNSFAWLAAEHHLLLDKAAAYADRAVKLAADNTERASYLDTKAEVAYKMGHKDVALKTENEAIALLDPKKDKKMLEQLSYQKGKFDGSIVDMNDDMQQQNQSATASNQGKSKKKN